MGRGERPERERQRGGSGGEEEEKGEGVSTLAQATLLSCW